MIEQIGDEARGALENADEDDDVLKMAEALLDEAHITSPTIGQAGQIGESLKKHKLIAATLACASGVFMTVITAGAGAAAGLAVGSSCAMLLSRAVKRAISYFVEKRLHLANAPKYMDELLWTEAYVDEVRRVSAREELSPITVETLRQV